MPGRAELSQTRVGPIVQDDRGYLWMGTQYGLNRYDGIRTRQFFHDQGEPNSLGGSYVHALLFDRSRHLWVATDQSLDRYDLLTERFEHFSLYDESRGDAPVLIRQINQDSRGTLWLSTSKGLAAFDGETGKWTFLHAVPGDSTSLSSDDVKTTGEDLAGNFWVATESALDLFDRDARKVIRHVAVRPSSEMTLFHESRAGVFWVIAGGRIGTLDRHREKFTEATQVGTCRPASIGKVKAILEDRNGDMWFGTETAGLLHLESGVDRMEFYTSPVGSQRGLSSSRVETLFEDARGDIWVGLHDAAPDMILRSGIAFTSYAHLGNGSVGPPSPLVTTLFEQSPGKLLIGTTRMLQLVDEKREKYQSVYPFLANREVFDVFHDRRNRMWFATNQGVIRFDPRRKELKNLSVPERGKASNRGALVQRLLEDHHGRLWAATWAGIDLYRAKSDSFVAFHSPQFAEAYYAIAEAPDGTLWLGGNLGVERLDPEQRQSHRYPYRHGDRSGPSDTRINSLFFDHAGRLWIGTQNGLDLWEPISKTFRTLTTKDGLAGNVISCILEDGARHLWLSTNDGLSRLDPESGRIANYSTIDGLPGRDLTGWGACAKGAEGRMFFGGFSGVAAFWPDRMPESSYVSPVLVSSITVDGKPASIGGNESLKNAMPYADRLSVSYRDDFRIGFLSLNFRDPRVGRLRYRMDGIDKEWREAAAGQTGISYSHLSAGTYLFHLQGGDHHGVWGGSEAKLWVRVSPPWWKHSYVQSGYVLAILLLVWLLWRHRARQLNALFRARVEERVSERTRVAREIEDTLLQGAQGLILKIEGATLRLDRNDPHRQAFEDALNGAETSLGQVRDVMEGLQKPPAPIEMLPSILQDYWDQHFAATSCEFSIHSTGQPSGLFEYNTAGAAFIVKKAIRRAVFFAKANHVDVEILFLDTQMKVSIKDDGAAYLSEIQTADEKTDQWGLESMYGSYVNGTLRIESEPGRGTVVNLTMTQPSSTIRSPSLLSHWRRFFRR
jgi:ligand-binding sensor domain-containing protein/signal transduction histidine kinase